MAQARILCIDTDAATALALMAAGHEVFAGTLGYTDGQPRLAMPPHEVDLIVCDLRSPACYDSDWWGPGRNDNTRYKIVANPPVAWKEIRGQTYPRFPIIHEGQMHGREPGSFGPTEINRAIAKAGVPFVLMLNPEWLQHVSYSSPDFANISWHFGLTKADRIDVAPPLITKFPEIEQSLHFARPLSFEILGGPTLRGDGIGLGGSSKADLTVHPVVSNVVGQQFGQVIEIGKGTIWALPKLRDNVAFLLLAAERVDSLQLQARQSTSKTEAVSSPPSAEAERDVFISHASEDKDAVARPLAERLVAQGVTVWFDEYELRLGDRLRDRIEHGLRRSRYGAVILSHSFFAKRWPQLELDGLFALEVGSKRILPIWHGLTVEDVRRYTPILSERLAISTDRGLDAVVTAVLAAVRPHR